jgi:hypothetical protein
MRPLVLLVLCVSSLFRQAIDICGPARIVSQADALSACPTITGNLVLATNAAGNIKLDGVESIEGNLTNEQCGNVVQLGCLMGLNELDGYSSDLLI